VDVAARDESKAPSNDSGPGGDDTPPTGKPPTGEKPGGDEPSGTDQKKRKKRPWWQELLIVVGAAVALSVLLQSFVVRVYQIPSGSMEATLQIGDRVMVDKISTHFRDWKAGDVIVFEGTDAWGHNNPEHTGSRSGNPVVRTIQDFGSLFGMAPPDGNVFIKRIIALPGQTVECCDDQNRVLVDGKPLDEPYLRLTHPQMSFHKVTVPPNHVWVMGDNRNNSADSRYHQQGPDLGAIPFDNIVGKARTVLFPFSHVGGITDHDPQGR
jgi:signal peptidase I